MFIYPFFAPPWFPSISEVVFGLNRLSWLGVNSTNNPPPRLILTTMLSLKFPVSSTPMFQALRRSHSIYATEHKEHPHCPSSLHCLRETDGRPPHTLPVILRCTILGSPNKKLTIREIYAAMENKYPWYKTAGNAWKVCHTRPQHW